MGRYIISSLYRKSCTHFSTVTSGSVNNKFNIFPTLVQVNHTKVTTDGTHHILKSSQQPFYTERFKQVLPFHDPGLAPVVDDKDKAYHIHFNGKPAYSQTYARTFGYYQNLATVIQDKDNSCWFHIDPVGKKVYQGSWTWTGNFQNGLCTVRDPNGMYFHIDSTGIKRTGGPFTYAGDFREGLAVVRSPIDGLCRHIEENGRIPSTKGYLDLDVFHKSFARARDEEGWFYIHRSNWDDVCKGVRFAMIEPFYNGQALCTRLDGTRCVISEEGKVMVELQPSPSHENSFSLHRMARTYWISGALIEGLKANLPSLVATAEESSVQGLIIDGYKNNYLGSLASAWTEMGLLREGKPTEWEPEKSRPFVSSNVPPAYTLTPKGRELLPGTLNRQKTEYWLQPRYINAWIRSSNKTAFDGLTKFDNSFVSTNKPEKDTFADLATKPEDLQRSRQVLELYAKESWKGIGKHFEPLLGTVTANNTVANERVIVDVGGGSGELLRQVVSTLFPSFLSNIRYRFICLDRPEVTLLNLEKHQQTNSTKVPYSRTIPDIEYLAADMFNRSHLPSGDIYILSRVLHDWDDEQAKLILQNIQQAAKKEFRVVVIDRVATTTKPYGLLSLHMQLLNKGRERRMYEWDQLFECAGYRLENKENPIIHNDHNIMVLASKVTASSPHYASMVRPQSPSPAVGRTITRGFATSARNGVSTSFPTGGILLVNHGYPPLYNAGSEIDIQNIALGLRRENFATNWNNVAVFSRESDPFEKDFHVRLTSDTINSSIPVFLVNNPREAPYGRITSDGIDNSFRQVMAQLRPRIVHFGHVNHLSARLPTIAKQEYGAKIVFTLHDFFFLCPRGQFLIVGPSPTNSLSLSSSATTDSISPPYELCHQQIHEKCAKRCFACRFGEDDNDTMENNYWTKWVEKRMTIFRKMADSSVDIFTVPSHHLRNKFLENGYPASKLRYLPYGFDHQRLSGRTRNIDWDRMDNIYTFGYIGRHEPSKGIHLLIDAVFQLFHDELPVSWIRPFSVVIFGRSNGAITSSLHRRVESNIRSLLARNPNLDEHRLRNIIQFSSEYNNVNIVRDVFNYVDCIVVPSIWDENSPLVIHEAQQVRVPVITANTGGMAELVHENINGYQFEHRNVDSLSKVMKKVLLNPSHMATLGSKGYVADGNVSKGNVPNIQEQIKQLVHIYNAL